MSSVSGEIIDHFFQACRNAQRKDLTKMIRSLSKDQLKLVWEARRKSTKQEFEGDEVTLLIEAASWGYSHIVDELLKSGAPVDGHGEHGLTALMVVSAFGHQEVVAILLQQKSIELNLQNDYGLSALHIASSADNQEVVAMLLQQSSIKVNLQIEDGWTALHMASYEGHQEVVSMLLQHPTIKPNLQTSNGETALHKASYRGHQEVVSILLLQTSIEPNLQSEKGTTALMFAAQRGFQQIVWLFLQHHSINLNLRDKSGFWYGNTALDLAKREGYSTIVEMLRRAQLGGQDQDCIVTEWWAVIQDCPDVCEEEATFMIEERYIVVKPSGRGMPCPERFRETKCPCDTGISNLYMYSGAIFGAIIMIYFCLKRRSANVSSTTRGQELASLDNMARNWAGESYPNQAHEDAPPSVPDVTGAEPPLPPDAGTNANDLDGLGPILRALEEGARELRRKRGNLEEQLKHQRRMAQSAYDLVDEHIQHFDKDRRFLETDLESAGAAQLAKLKASFQREKGRKKTAGTPHAPAKMEGTPSSGAAGLGAGEKGAGPISPANALVAIGSPTATEAHHGDTGGRTGSTGRKRGRPKGQKKLDEERAIEAELQEKVALADQVNTEAPQAAAVDGGDGSNEQVNINHDYNEIEKNKKLETSELLVVFDWLKSIQLEGFFEAIKGEGVATKADLAHLDRHTLKEDVGMNGVERGRFMEKLNNGEREWSSPEKDNLLFISHFKDQAGVDARLLKTQFVLHFQRAGIDIPDDSFFLDSDNLHDLHALTDQVQKSANFLFILTSGVFTRPWCLVELVTAIDHGCTIIPIKLEDSSASFNFDDGPQYVNDFCEGFLSYPGKTQIDLEKCLKVLEDSGIDTLKVQDSICFVLQLIAKPLHLSSMSQAVLSAEIGDVVKLMSV